MHQISSSLQQPESEEYDYKLQEKSEVKGRVQSQETIDRKDSKLLNKRGSSKTLETVGIQLFQSKLGNQKNAVTSQGSKDKSNWQRMISQMSSQNGQKGKRDGLNKKDDLKEFKGMIDGRKGQG